MKRLLVMGSNAWTARTGALELEAPVKGMA